MMGKRNRKHDGAEKVLEVDASMQGALVFKDPVNLRINGMFEGTLNTKGSLMIGERAVVNADITGESVIIAGKVTGNVHATRELKLVAPGRVIGEVATPLLSVAEGAILDGSCRMLTRAKMPEAVTGTGRMTAEEVSRYLEIGLDMVLDWVTTGRLPGSREGDVWYFDRSKIDEWVASGKIQ